MSKTVVFVGNCQLEALGRLYRHLNEPDPEVRTVYIPAYENADDHQRGAIESADVVVKQILDFDQKIGDIQTQGVVYPFPHVGGAFLWPYTGQAHPLNKSVPFFDSSGPYPPELGDSFLNRMIAAEVDAKTAVERYLEIDVGNVKRLDRLLDLLLEKQRARDRTCGYDFADFIHARFRSERVFRSPNHPETSLMMTMAAQLFERLGVNSTLVQKEATEPSIELFPVSETPVHPNVISHFSLEFLTPAQQYRFFDEGNFTFPEYAERYMGFAWSPVLAEGMYLVRSGQSDLAAEVLAKGIIDSPRSAIGKFSLSRLLTAQNRVLEALSLAEEATNLEPGNAEFKRIFDELLATSSFKLGPDLHLQFGQNGNSKRFQTYGWSEPENNFTWTNGPRAQLYLGRQTELSDYRLEIDIHPLTYPGKEFQRVSVRLNNVTVSNICAEKSGKFLIWIPGELFPPVGEALTLTFELPDAARPVDFSENASDSRLLGLSFGSITFTAVPAAQIHSESYEPGIKSAKKELI